MTFSTNTCRRGRRGSPAPSNPWSNSGGVNAAMGGSEPLGELSRPRSTATKILVSNSTRAGASASRVVLVGWPRVGRELPVALCVDAFQDVGELRIGQQVAQEFGQHRGAGRRRWSNEAHAAPAQPC